MLRRGDDRINKDFRIRRSVMFDLLIWRFEYWLVALILVLFYEDRNKINSSDVFNNTISDLLDGKITLQFCSAGVIKNQSISQRRINE
jgi:hypothetical protein